MKGSQRLIVAHAWDTYVGTVRRDLHSELRQRSDVVSRQYVRRLEATGSPLPPDTVALGVVPARAASRSFVARLRGRLAREVSTLRYLALLDRSLRRDRPDVLHAHFGTMGWRVSRLAERHRLPLVISFYGVDVSQIVRERQWRRRYAVMFRRAAHLVVLCDEARDRLVTLGCPAEKITIWDHPVDLDAYEYRARQPQGALRLITAARFVEKKGYPFLLGACARLVRQGRDLTLTAVGYGPLRAEIEGQAEKLGLGQRFRLIDTVGMPDFDGFYNRALHEHDIFVLPSTTAASGDDEGGPALSLVMAQAAGLPVICTPFAGAARTVVDHETGLFCQQDDATSLAERIAYLADRPEMWNQLGRAGSKLVRGQFDFAGQVEEMVAIYRAAMP